MGKKAARLTAQTRSFGELGRSLERSGRDAEAAQAYRRAIAQEPNTVEWRLALARLLLAYGELREAGTCLTQALSVAPDSAEPHLLLAQALTIGNNPAAAETHLRQAISLDPAGHEAHAMLGYRLQTLGRFDEARSHFSASIELQPAQSVSYYGLMQGKRVTSEDAPLVEQVARLVESKTLDNSEHMILCYGLGKAYEDLERYEDAMVQYDDANRLAFEVNLGRRPFRAGEYRAVLDRMIGQFSEEKLAEMAGFGSESKAPIFVVGMMRSGTTLVEQILASHPEVGGGGEMEFWLNEGPTAFDPGGRLILPKLASLSRRYLALLGRVAPGKARVTDKMPQNFQMLGLIHSAFPEAAIIHVRRDPLDNCLSIYTTPYDLSPEFAHVQSSIVFAYEQYLRIMEHWRSVLPRERFMEIEYEELVADKERTVRRLVAFCGLEWTDTVLRHDKSERVVTTPSMWQVRQPIYSSSVGRWKRFEPWLGDLASLKTQSGGRRSP